MVIEERIEEEITKTEKTLEILKAMKDKFGIATFKAFNVSVSSGITTIWIDNYEDFLEAAGWTRKTFGIKVIPDGQFSSGKDLFFRYLAVGHDICYLFQVNKDNVPSAILCECKIIETVVEQKEYRMVCET